MTETRAPYHVMQDDLDEQLLSCLLSDDTRPEIIHALHIIHHEYAGHGRLIVEFRGGRAYLIGQESVSVISKR